MANTDRKPPRAGMGRPKGAKNKTSAAVKDMVLQALSNKGGVEYLERQADANPVAFMALISKVIPLQLTGEDGGPVQLAAYAWQPPQPSPR